MEPDGEEIDTKTLTYHSACFTCTDCSVDLVGIKFLRCAGQVVCVPCKEKVRPWLGWAGLGWLMGVVMALDHHLQSNLWQAWLTSRNPTPSHNPSSPLSFVLASERNTTARAARRG